MDTQQQEQREHEEEMRLLAKAQDEALEFERRREEFFEKEVK